MRRALSILTRTRQPNTNLETTVTITATLPDGRPAIYVTTDPADPEAGGWFPVRLLSDGGTDMSPDEAAAVTARVRGVSDVRAQ